MTAEVDIKFDRNNGVFHSGQIVSGTVIVNFQKSIKIKGISITIRGYSKSEWHDDNKNKVKTGRPYTGSEEHLSLTTYLVQSDAENSIDFPAGLQTFVFRCHLPDDVPSSFEGTYGHIRYQAKVIIEQPWKSNQSYETGFTVLKSVDLNRECPQSKAPIEVDKIKTYGCGICRTAPLILKVRLPQSGFAPGQIIPIETQIISSGSVVEVLEAWTSLRRIVSYRAEKPTSSFNQEISELLRKNSGHLQSNSSCTFCENLQLPNVPPTTLMHSKIIQINYDVKIELILGEMRNEGNRLEVLCPITVGTVPLLGDSTGVVAPTLDISQAHFVPAEDEGASTSMPPPPPSYEESIQQVDVEVVNAKYRVPSTEL